MIGNERKSSKNCCWEGNVIVGDRRDIENLIFVAPRFMQLTNIRDGAAVPALLPTFKRTKEKIPILIACI